eukprot:4091245-Pyramimonas_sp.AAC.1
MPPVEAASIHDLLRSPCISWEEQAVFEGDEVSRDSGQDREFSDEGGEMEASSGGQPVGAAGDPLAGFQSPIL